MLDRVLHRLQAAEIGRGLNLARITTGGRIIDRQWNSGGSGCSQGCRHPFAYQLLRVDAAGQILQSRRGLGHRGTKLGDSWRHLFGIRGEQPPGQSEVDCQSKQVLLGTIVNVALQASALGISRGDHTLPGGPQLSGPLLGLNQPPLQILGQLNVSKGHPSLSAQVTDQLLLNRLQRSARSLVHHQPAQHLRPVPDRIATVFQAPASGWPSERGHRDTTSTAAPRRAGSSNTSTVTARVPSPTSRASSGAISSVATVSATLDTKRANRSYGDTTNRRWRNLRRGSKATATMPVASTDNSTLGRFDSPIRKLPPTTTIR